MRCELRHILIASLLALALSGPAFGQLEVDTEEVAEEEEEIRRYTVELIVFEYTNSALAGNERFLPDEPPITEELEPIAPLTFGDPGAFDETEAAVAIDDVFEEQDPLEQMLPEEIDLDEELEELPSHIIQTQLEVLDAQEHAMKEIYEKLVELDAYRPIMRAAWTQATYEKEMTLPIKLRRLGNAPLRLDGTLMLYLSRYLHLVVDLTIESREERSADRYDNDTRYYGDRWSTSYGFAYDGDANLIKYTISEDRIFRNGELRYYDHPKFGVLARVTRVEEEVPETDEMFLLPGESVGAASAANE
jgi:hypothetical protein